ncbi:hypothetical protein ACFX13_033505 [Malus domestica]|uniref:Uncharacterized protein n=1 Tax=Malus domestica TaxID=3750 RepID=A0A498K780_MALDO|nr:hypothetical protein DVH24_026684 [Malus domestica]
MAASSLQPSLQIPEAVKKTRHATNKPDARSIVGATLKVIHSRITEKPEVHGAAREAALRQIKERIKKTEDEKNAKESPLKGGERCAERRASDGGILQSGPSFSDLGEPSGLYP